MNEKNTRPQIKEFTGPRPIKQSDERQSGVSDYRIKNFLELGIKKGDLNEKIIANDLGQALENDFNILPIVKHYRGMRDQEKQAHESKVKKSIDAKVGVLQGKAYDEGFEQGRKEGEKSIRQELAKEMKVQASQFAEYIEAVNAQQIALLKSGRSEMIQALKALTKWVILRELKDDGKYLERLVSKLVSELKSWSSLTLKVGKENFRKMPEAIAVLEEKFSSVENVKVEVLEKGPQMGEAGMILEFDSGIFDATIETQLANLDELFDILEEDDDKE